MPDTSTPSLGLIKPEVGASRSTWGNKWNTNADGIDSHYASMLATINTLQSQVATLQNQMTAALQQGAPIGAIFPWPMFTSAPGGYLGCDGGVYLVSQFPKLAAILGANYGGDGATNFGVPNLRGCVLTGWDGGTGRLGGLVSPDVPGAIGGAPYIAISEAQMPSHRHFGATDGQGEHNHSYTNYSLPAGAGFAIGSGAQFIAGVDGTSNAGFHAHNIATDFQGGGQGHPNVQVSCIVWWLIRAA